MRQIPLVLLPTLALAAACGDNHASGPNAADETSTIAFMSHSATGSQFAAGWSVNNNADWIPSPPSTNPLGAPDPNCVGTSTPTGSWAQFGFAAFSIPASNTVVGIEVRVKYRSSAANTAQLVLNGSLVGSERTLPLFFTGPSNCANTGWVSAGGASDLWGTSLTKADFNAGNVGVRITQNGPTVDLDAIELVVHHASPNSPPTADAGPDQDVVGTAAGADVTLDGSGSSDPDGDPLTYSWTEGAVEIATGVNPTVSLSLGNHVIVLTVDDGEFEDTDEVVIDINAPPEADAGPDQTVECTGDGCAEVTLDGSGSSDPDGDALTYSWSMNGGEFSTDLSPTVKVPIGTTVFTLTVSDGVLEDTDDVQIKVEDTAPPVINAATASPDELWPPNHSMITVEVTVDVADVCDPGASCVIVAVTSNEPDNGLGDGDTPNDIQITGPLTVDLRAERSGTGNGRVYSIVIECVDASSNRSQATVEVRVPKNKGNKE